MGHTLHNKPIQSEYSDVTGRYLDPNSLCRLFTLIVGSTLINLCMCDTDGLVMLRLRR